MPSARAWVSLRPGPIGASTGAGRLASILARACIQLGGVCRERNRIKRGTPFYDPELGVILGIPKSVVE
jgi:hypothetical protein